MAKRLLLVGMVLALGTTTLAVLWAAEEKKPEPPKPSDSIAQNFTRPLFEGQAIWIQNSRGEQPSIFMEKPEIKTLGNRAFLVGKSLGPGSPSGVVWCPVNDVVHIREFKDRAEMGKFVRLEP